MELKPIEIIRRIDDLGRVVIPKEIRRTMRIKEGEPLELYVVDGGVLLKKYSPEPKPLPEKLICDAGNVEAMTVNAIIDYLKEKEKE